MLKLLLHLAAEGQPVVGGGAVGQDQVVSCSPNQIRVSCVAGRISEDPSLFLDQTDPGLKEDDKPGVMVLLGGLDADVELVEDAGVGEVALVVPMVALGEDRPRLVVPVNVKLRRNTKFWMYLRN